MDALINIAGTFGVPVALLAVGMFAIWKIGKFSANDVVKPLTQGVLAYLAAQTTNHTFLIQEVIRPLTVAAIDHMATQQQATVAMSVVLEKVSQNLEAIHTDQLKLLERYQKEGMS